MNKLIIMFAFVMLFLTVGVSAIDSNESTGLVPYPSSNTEGTITSNFTVGSLPIQIVAFHKDSNSQILHFAIADSSNTQVYVNGTFVGDKALSNDSSFIFSAGMEYRLRTICATTCLQYFNDSAILPINAGNITYSALTGAGASTYWNLDKLEIIVLSGAFETVLDSPANATSSVSDSITFNATITPYDFNVTNATFFLWDSGGSLINQTTNIINGDTNIANETTFNINMSQLPNEAYTWNIEAKVTNSTGDIITNMTNANRTLNYGHVVNSIDFDLVVKETEATSFILNVTLGESVVMNEALLVYNNTNYATTVSSTSINRSISSTFNVDQVTTSANVSFHWVLTLDGTNFTTTISNQTIENVDIDNCTTNTVQIINYTIYDEDTRALAVSPTINTTIEILLKLTGDLTGKVFNFYSNTTGSNPLTVCIDSNLSTDVNYRIDSEVKYSGSDRVTEYHNINNQIVNTSSIPLNFDLYDLLSTSSTEFLITYKDKFFNPVAGALIEIHRQYLDLGVFLPVEIPKTDIDGRTIGHFVTNDVVYNIFVKENNTLLSTYEGIRLFCADPNGDCRIALDALGSSSEPEDFQTYLNISYRSEYNKTSQTYKFVFSTTDGTSHTFNLTAIKFDNYQNETICSQQLTVSSGTLSCAFPNSHINSTAIIKIFLDDELFINLILPLKDTSGNPLGATGYFLAFLAVLILPFLAYASLPIALILLLVGIVLVGAVGLIQVGGFVGGLSAFLWVVIAAGILIWKATSGENNG